jgi:hypothetical protein
VHGESAADGPHGAIERNADQVMADSFSPSLTDLAAALGLGSDHDPWAELGLQWAPVVLGPGDWAPEVLGPGDWAPTVVDPGDWTPEVLGPGAWAPRVLGPGSWTPIVLGAGSSDAGGFLSRLLRGRSSR